MLSETSPKAASRLFTTTILASTAGIFSGIYFLFIDQEMALRIATALMIGVVGLLSFLRHSVFYQSDQSRLASGTRKSAVSNWSRARQSVNGRSRPCSISIGMGIKGLWNDFFDLRSLYRMCFIDPYAGSLASN